MIIDYLKNTSFIFIYKENHNDSNRYQNLITSLNWIIKTFPIFYKFFDIIIVEQDKFPKLNIQKLYNDLNQKLSINYQFIYNPFHFNRGWAFNVAIKYFTNKKVIIMADNDILLMESIIKLIKMCYNDEYDVLSPYNRLYFTTEYEKNIITKNLDLSFLGDSNKINNSKNVGNSYTIFGGLTIINRDIFLKLGGFEEYNGYGYEDRAMDTVSLNLIDNSRIYFNEDTYFHLFHEKVFFNLKIKKIMNLIKTDLNNNYGCFTKFVKKDEFLHKFCKHKNKNELLKLIEIRKKKRFNINCYADNIIPKLFN